MAVFATTGPAGVPVTTSIFPYITIITRPGTPTADCLFWIEHDWNTFLCRNLIWPPCDKHSHCEAAPNRLQASPSIGPWRKHIKPVLILLRPDPRKSETLKPGYFWLHWNQLEVLAKGFRPAGEFCGHLPGPPGRVWYIANRYGLLSEKTASWWNVMIFLICCRWVQRLKHGNI